eukprot:9073785-Pyramimonas_sp.AAC.1
MALPGGRVYQRRFSANAVSVARAQNISGAAAVWTRCIQTSLRMESPWGSVLPPAPLSAQER